MQVRKGRQRLPSKSTPLISHFILHLYLLLLPPSLLPPPPPIPLSPPPRVTPGPKPRHLFLIHPLPPLFLPPPPFRHSIPPSIHTPCTSLLSTSSSCLSPFLRFTASFSHSFPSLMRFIRTHPPFPSLPC